MSAAAPCWAAGKLPRALDGKPSRLPSCEASLEVGYLLVARSNERGLALSGARPDHAIEGDTVECVDLSDALGHLVERDVESARDMG